MNIKCMDNYVFSYLYLTISVCDLACSLLSVLENFVIKL
jgi:hypothetical protein